MAQLILLVLLAVVMALPSALIAYILISIFPNFNYPILAFMSIGSIVLLIKYYDKIQLKKHLSSSAPNGEYKKFASTGTMVILIIASLFGVYMVFDSNKVELYIDNENEQDIKVKVNNKRVTVAAHHYKTIKVVAGKVTLLQDDVEKIVTVKRSQHTIEEDNKHPPKIFWVWNLNGKGSYIKTTLTYATVLSDMIDKNSSTREDDFKIIDDELFEVTAHYVFEIPEKIKSSKSFGFGKEEKIVLYRLSDLQDKYKNKEPQKYNDNTEDTIVVTSKKDNDIRSFKRKR
jgi:hypothetical protein